MALTNMVAVGMMKRANILKLLMCQGCGLQESNQGSKVWHEQLEE